MSASRPVRFAPIVSFIWLNLLVTIGENSYINMTKYNLNRNEFYWMVVDGK